MESRQELQTEIRKSWQFSVELREYRTTYSVALIRLASAFSFHLQFFMTEKVISKPEGCSSCLSRYSASFQCFSHHFPTLLECNGTMQWRVSLLHLIKRLWFLSIKHLLCTILQILFFFPQGSSDPGLRFRFNCGKVDRQPDHTFCAEVYAAQRRASAFPL